MCRYTYVDVMYTHVHYKISSIQYMHIHRKCVQVYECVCIRAEIGSSL